MGRRSGKLYLALNMKYSNIQYPLALPVAAVATDPANMPGYMVFDRIVDADCAEGVAQIPGLYGRDWQNITMTERNGVEYLHLRRALYGCRSRAPLQRCLLLVHHSGRRLCPLVSGGFRRRGQDHDRPGARARRLRRL